MVTGGLIEARQPATSADANERMTNIKTSFFITGLLIQTNVFKPIEIGVVRAGLSIAARIHGDIRADKTAGNRSAQDAAIYRFGQYVPFINLIGKTKVISLLVSFNS